MQVSTQKPALRRNLRGSCIECFKRKKKCDKEQPCYNCTRRHPPVECIYQKLESFQGKGTELVLQLSPKRPDTELNAGARPNPPNEPSSSIEKAIKKVPPDDTFHLLRWVSTSSKSGTHYEATNSDDDVDAKYAQFKAQLINQKFSTLSKLGYSIGCGTLDMLRMLSVEGTSSNAKFFETHNKVMTRFDYSIDGFGKVPELYENAWMLFTIHSPILLHLNLLKAAIARSQAWLPETNFEKVFLYFAPPSEPGNQAAVIRLRLRAISLLKARLKSPVNSVDDESIAAACYMIYLEWTWNDVKKEFTGLMPHVRGVREMLRQRGGLHKLGQSTVLAMVVMLAHYHLATNLECDGFVCPTELLQDKFIPDHRPTMQGIESPLWISTGSFADRVNTDNLNPATAQILDWMSFLTAQIRSCIFNNTTQAKYSQVMLSATRISTQLSALPSAHEPHHPATADFIYEAVRLAALVYTRAILQHTKLSQACGQEVISALLEATSRVPLRTWKEMPGI